MIDVVVDPEEPVVPVTSTPPADPSMENTVIVASLVGAPVSAAFVEETVEAELVGDPPHVWVRAIGQATVPVPLDELLEESRVPVQRASLESLDPLIDPLPLVLAGEAAIAQAATGDDEGEGVELAAIGARPYVNR
jgi:hypothetical protein